MFVSCLSFKHSGFVRHSSLSRCQPLDQPIFVRLSRVTKTIMQTVRSSLPEFDLIRFDPITTPVRRQRNGLVTEAFGHLRQARVENAASVEHLALTRRPCA